MPSRTPTLSTLIGLAAIVCLQAGCYSLNWSSESSSNSIDWSSNTVSRSSEWSSDSSSPTDEEPTAYQNDVRDYTATFAASDGNLNAFQRDVSAIAEGHGITDWEREQETYVAIGRGLARSGVERERYEEIATALANEDQARLSLVRAGYETTPRR